MTTLLYDFFTYLEVAVRESRGLGERIFCLIVHSPEGAMSEWDQAKPGTSSFVWASHEAGKGSNQAVFHCLSQAISWGRTGRGPTGAGTPSWWAASIGHAAFIRYAAVMPQYQPQLSISLWYHHTVINNSKVSQTQSCLNKDTWVGT